MLTGERPFSGSTPAQLAAQHMHGRPNLKSLPRGDQSVVNRAPSKDPTNRYPSCLAFIEELLNRSSRSTTRRSRRPRRIQHDATLDPTRPVSDSDLPRGRASEPVRFADPVTYDVKKSFVRPTLFVGIGATGTQVVCALRRLLRGKFAQDERIPAIKTLCIDSDRDHLLAATFGTEQDALGEDELLDLPLRPSEGYREAQLNFGWLSRRWIYNIPRSRNTEGIRPLGRLAIADHSERLLECLHALTRKLLDPAALEQTANTFQRAATVTPRVYVVASISGGIGSGSIPDLGCVVRQVMLDQGADEVEVVGLLLHDPGRTDADRNVGAANSYCCLKELNHFAENGYPGDETCGFEEFDPGEHSFDQLYFVHLGRGVPALDDPVEQRFAELLFAETTTHVGAALDVSRSDKPAGSGLDVRTLGVSSISFGVEHAIPLVTNRLAAELINYWLDEGQGFELDGFFETLFEAVQLTPNQLMAGLEDAVSATSDEPHVPRLARMLIEHYHQWQDQPHPQQLDAILDEVGQQLDTWLKADNANVNEHVTGIVERSQNALQTHVMKLVEMPGHRLSNLQAGIRRGNRTLIEYRDDISNDLRQDRLLMRQREEAVLAAESTAQAMEALTDIAERIFRQALLQLGLSALEQVHRVVERLDEQQSRVHAGLSRMKAKFRQSAIPADDEDRLTAGLCQQAVACTSQELTGTIACFDESLQRLIAEENRSFASYVLSNANEADKLEGKIASVCRPHAAAALSVLNPEKVLLESGVSQDAMSNWIRERVERAVPELMDCGGTLRSFLLSPSNPGFQGIVRTVRDCLKATPTLVPLERGDVLVLNEITGVSLSDLALRLIEESPACVELIPRIGTRIDVDWDNLTGLA